MYNKYTYIDVLFTDISGKLLASRCVKFADTEGLVLQHLAGSFSNNSQKYISESGFRRPLGVLEVSSAERVRQTRIVPQQEWLEVLRQSHQVLSHLGNILLRRETVVRQVGAQIRQFATFRRPGWRFLDEHQLGENWREDYLVSRAMQIRTEFVNSFHDGIQNGFVFCGANEARSLILTLERSLICIRSTCFTLLKRRYQTLEFRTSSGIKKQSLVLVKNPTVRTLQFVVCLDDADHQSFFELFDVNEQFS